MADYSCPHGPKSSPQIRTVPADYFLTVQPTKMWHGKEALDRNVLTDLAYACCAKHLDRAVKTLLGKDDEALIKVRRVNV